MSPLEDEIRDTLRAEADSMREVRPLSLQPAAAHPDSAAASRARRARWLLAWRGPVAAVAAVVLVAAALVALKSLRNEHTVPAASASSEAGSSSLAGAAPRYYVKLGAGGFSIGVGDERTGRTVATYPLPNGSGLSIVALGAAGDDRTFVAATATNQWSITWYMLRIHPGSADPVQVIKLPVKSPAGDQVREIALSADGTELAALSGAWTSKTHTLRVYSVATGRLQHSWSATSNLPNIDGPFTDLSWVGDSTLGFAVTYTPEVREEVRTLNIGASGTDLLADSRVVWSQYVPAAARGIRNAPHACDTPFLTGNGQAVVCGNSTYSVHDKRLSAVWLAYPLETPRRPRVIGSLQTPPDVTEFSGQISVEWTNPSGTEVIGAWNTSVPISGGGGTVTSFDGYVADGAVRPFTPPPGPLVTW